MSIRFSRITAMTEEKATIFYVGGVPSSQRDLEPWTAFQSFAFDAKKDEAITVNVETYEYGEGDPFDAIPEEVAYIYMRESKRPDFVEARAKKVETSSFVLWLEK